jgi:anaerobic ribonucleoside-triphosphate reductase
VSIALQKWYTWEISLRNELVRLRSRVKKRDGEKYLKPVPDSEEVKAIANTAFSQDNPLAAETVLSRARWTVLDECEAGHHFDMDKLTVYTLKLLLLERKASLDRENGIEKYNRIMKQFDESFESREKALWKK